MTEKARLVLTFRQLDLDEEFFFAGGETCFRKVTSSHAVIVTDERTQVAVDPEQQVEPMV